MKLTSLKKMVFNYLARRSSWLVWTLFSGILLILILCLSSWQIRSHSDPLFVLSQESASQFSILVKNPTTNTIKIGRMDTGLGGDQFQFEVKVGDDVLSIRRRFEWLIQRSHGPQGGPLTIPPGSCSEIKVDLADFSWICTEQDKDKIENHSKWESVRIVYSLGHGEFKRYEDVLVGNFCSSWISTRALINRGQENSSTSDGSRQNESWSRVLHWGQRNVSATVLKQE